MNHDRLLELIGRKLSGEASQQELTELEQMLISDPSLGERYKMLQQFWEHHDHIHQQVIEEGLRKALNRLELPGSAPVLEMEAVDRKPKRMRFVWGAAAAVFVVSLGAWMFWSRQTRNDTVDTSSGSLVEKQNSKGVKSTIELSDGSKIWLNADSKIQYSTAFTGNTREVHLNGEAFFDVAKNPSKPFIIHLANGTVRVLGTSFNVRAYDNEKVVETSVTTGKVAFIPKYEKKKKKQDTVYLTSNNKVRYLFTEEEVITEPTVSIEDKAWTEGKLIFKDMSFESIAVELERNFGKKVVFVSDAPRRFRLTGSFQNNSLHEIMYYLSKTKDFTYKITNTEVLIGDVDTRLPD
jgi:transmembrane sensor